MSKYDDAMKDRPRNVSKYDDVINARPRNVSKYQDANARREDKLMAPRCRPCNE